MHVFKIENDLKRKRREERKGGPTKCSYFVVWIEKQQKAAPLRFALVSGPSPESERERERERLDAIGRSSSPLVGVEEKRAWNFDTRIVLPRKQRALTHVNKPPANLGQNTHGQGTGKATLAPVDVKELKHSFIFVIDVPGLVNENIKVHVENDNVLKISGERMKEACHGSDKNIKYVRLERPSGKFMRKFNLPRNCDLENISSCCHEGVLTIAIPKIAPPEPHKPKTFEVKVESTHSFGGNN